jgi:hypothetical protein
MFTGTQQHSYFVRGTPAKLSVGKTVEEIWACVTGLEMIVELQL